MPAPLATMPLAAVSIYKIGWGGRAYRRASQHRSSRRTRKNTLTLARTGGVGATPLRFFADSEKRRRVAPPDFGVPYMSVKLATATATVSASVTDFVHNGHVGAVGPPDSKNQVHFDLRSLLQGQNQGQTKGNALAPKLTVRLRRKWSQTIPRPKF